MAAAVITVNFVSTPLYISDRAGQLARIEGHRLLHPPQVLVAAIDDEQSFNAVIGEPTDRVRFLNVPAGLIDQSFAAPR
ncbi:hypothetical protein ONZ45_g18885 [Pleurotus djamor]|nr:hypothetical protein ONZ45_g18885 [Pleurotus djamor]